MATKNKGFGYWSSRREGNQAAAGPSPVVPLFFLSVASAIVVARMVMRYQGWSLFGNFMKRQNNVMALFLLPLLLVLAVALIPSLQKWRNPGSIAARSKPANSNGFLDWNYYTSTNATTSTAISSDQQQQQQNQHGDGTGIGLFIFLIFVLLLFPWR